ncbi:MAG: hypothetical protein U0R44_05655 [Candidatus Micrarchaeia archaeon]
MDPRKKSTKKEIFRAVTVVVYKKTSSEDFGRHKGEPEEITRYVGEVKADGNEIKVYVPTAVELGRVLALNIERMKKDKADIKEGASGFGRGSRPPSSETGIEKLGDDEKDTLRKILELHNIVVRFLR